MKGKDPSTNTTGRQSDEKGEKYHNSSTKNQQKIKYSTTWKGSMAQRHSY